MKFKIATLLALSLIAPGLFVASTSKPAEADHLCPTFWDKVNPFKTCSHVNFRGHTPPPPPVKYVKIRNKAWGRCLDLPPQSNVNGGSATVFDCLEHPNQTWTIDDVGNGEVKIRNKAWWGKCLDLIPQNNWNGGSVTVYDCISHPHQTWIIQDVGNGEAKIRNKAWGRCLDLPPQNNQNNGSATVYDCLSHPNQTWIISTTQ